MSIVSLKTELRQQMKLTPQLLQSIELLQMNSQELLSYLGRMAEENPTLELQDAPDMADSLVRLRQRAAWLDAGVPGSFRTHREDSVLEPGAPDRSLNSLSAFLCDQLDRRRLSGPLLALTKYMVQLLDEDGYLAQEDLDGLAELKIPQAMVEQALDILQSLEPAGVGARGLSECLVLQLSRQKKRRSTCHGYRCPLSAGAGAQALRAHRQGAGHFHGGASDSRKGHCRPGTPAGAGFSAAGAHCFGTSGCVCFGNGRRAAGGAE